MNNYFEVNYIKKVARVNYVLLAFFLAVSVTSHLIAFRLTLLDHYALIPASFIYMSAFVLTDVFAAYNSRKFVVLVLILEAFVNLFFMVVTNIVVRLPYPGYLRNVHAFNDVFSPIMILFLANLAGTFVAFLLDVFVFYYFYRTKKLPFLVSSLISSVSTILLYTFITDYFAFKQFYPLHIYQLIFANIVTNFIVLAVYTVLGQILLTYIFRYLNRYSESPGIA